MDIAYLNSCAYFPDSQVLSYSVYSNENQFVWQGGFLFMEDPQLPEEQPPPQGRMMLLRLIEVDVSESHIIAVLALVPLSVAQELD